MVTLMSGCAKSGDVLTVDTACNWVKPIYLTDADIMTLDPQTKRAILIHNESWFKVCDTTMPQSQ